MVKGPKREIKVLDYYTSNLGVSAAGVILTPLVNFAQGTGYFNQFIGRTIKPLGLDLRWYSTASVASLSPIIGADQNNIVRYLVFQWMNNTVPVVADILQDTVTAPSMSPINITNYQYIKVLADIVDPVWLTYDTSSTAGGISTFGRRYIKGKHMSEICMDTNGPKWAEGGIYILMVSDSGAVPNPGGKMFTRLTFED